MFHLPLFEAPNGLAEALITGREKLFVAHMTRQQAYDSTALEEYALDEYARQLAAPGALHGGIEYFRAHTVDALHNLESAKTKLPMPVLTMGGAASLGAHPGLEVWPPAERLRSVMIDECGYYLAEERPDRFTEDLLAFFAEPV